MPATKRVVWDESNLRANAEYQRLHPVTMHITEPKTPYVYLDDDVVDDADAEGGGSSSARRDAARASPSTSPWLRYESSHAGEGGDADTHGGTQAQRSGEVSGGGAATSSNNNNNNNNSDGNDDTTATTTWDPVTNAFVRELKKHIVADHSDAPRAPVSSSGRPMLAPGTVTGELAQQRHASEFVKMRRAVYADEGAKFKALLAQQRQKQQAEDDDEDDEDDDEDDDNDDDNTARAQDRQATSASRADGKQTSEYEYPYNY